MNAATGRTDGEADRYLRERMAEIDERLRLAYQAERLAAVARLAAGVAHEINNPVAFMRSNLCTLGQYMERVAGLRERLHEAPAAWRDLDLDFIVEDSRALVNESIAGADRIAHLTRALLGFSNVDKPDERMTDVNDCVRAAVGLIEAQKPAGVRIELDLRPLPAILCLPGHLNQAFFNVIENAVQACGKDGLVRIDTAVETPSVVIRIVDGGCGIPPEDMPKLFDPFFTTRPVGVGTGLGLTVARDIVRVHDGEIGIDSAPGRGTAVTVRLPL